jgi:hypothetical protein
MSGLSVLHVSSSMQTLHLTWPQLSTMHDRVFGITQVSESRQMYDKNNTLRILIAAATGVFINCTLSVFPTAAVSLTYTAYWDWCVQ